MARLGTSKEGKYLSEKSDKKKKIAIENMVLKNSRHSKHDCMRVKNFGVWFISWKKAFFNCEFIFTRIRGAYLHSNVFHLFCYKSWFRQHPVNVTFNKWNVCSLCFYLFILLVTRFEMYLLIRRDSCYITPVK